MEPGRCFRCGEWDEIGEYDGLCDDCYGVLRWEEITAINCNPQVDEYIPDDADPDIDEI